MLVNLSAAALKFLALLVFANLSLVHRLPLNVAAGLAWACWAFVASRQKARRVLAALGLGLTALSWWEITRTNLFALAEEASHTIAAGRHWSEMRMTSLWYALLFAVAGAALLACADFGVQARRGAAADTGEQEEPDQGRVWPPPPVIPR